MRLRAYDRITQRSLDTLFVPDSTMVAHAELQKMRVYANSGSRAIEIGWHLANVAYSFQNDCKVCIILCLRESFVNTALQL